MRNRPSVGARNEASAMPASRYARRACDGSAGSIASSISSLLNGPSWSAVTSPSMRTEGGAPQRGCRVGDPGASLGPRALNRMLAGARATHALAPSAVAEERCVEKPRERDDLPEDRQQRVVEPRADGERRRQLAPREELP